MTKSNWLPNKDLSDNDVECISILKTLKIMNLVCHLSIGNYSINIISTTLHHDHVG